MKSVALPLVATFSLSIGMVHAAFPQVISIGSETLSAGGDASVAVIVSGLGHGTALGGFDINIAYTPSVLEFASASYGDPILGDQLNLEGFGTFSGTTPSSGKVELAELSFDSPTVLEASQASQFTLATLTFDTVSPGMSALGLSVNAVSDQSGDSLSPRLENGSIKVTESATPAPEIDPLSGASAIALLIGSIVVLEGRRSSNRSLAIGGQRSFASRQ